MWTCLLKGFEKKKKETHFCKYRQVYAMLMRRNKAGTVVHGCLIPARLIWVCACIRTLGRSRWVGACNSHTKPMSRHFYRLIYFKYTFSFVKERQFRCSDAVTSISFVWLVMALSREPHSRQIRSENKSVYENVVLLLIGSCLRWWPSLNEKSLQYGSVHNKNVRHL